jgi:hypothetical protein
MYGLNKDLTTSDYATVPQRAIIIGAKDRHPEY